MHVGTVAAGRIGLAILQRLKPFHVKPHYFQRHRLPESVEKELDLTFHTNVDDMVRVCDVVTINAPLHPGTLNMFNDKLLSKMKRGAYIVDTARTQICDRDAIVGSLESGQLAGHAGDVWYQQPAPKHHSGRSMPYNGMTPHMSGMSSGQARYAGVRETPADIAKELGKATARVKLDAVIDSAGAPEMMQFIALAARGKIRHTLKMFTFNRINE
jgi:formate dehydrogenase